MSDADQVLQRVSSGVEVVVTEVRALRQSHEQLFADFSQHRRDDREDFNKVFTVIEANRKDRNDQFDKVIERIVERLDAQDKRQKDADKLSYRAQGAGWVIVGIVTFLGTALIAVLSVLAEHWWTKGG